MQSKTRHTWFSQPISPTLVRAWIGTEDQLKSLVAKGGYAPSHDDYNVHAVAPGPLPEQTMSWIEIQKPDGKTFVEPGKSLMG